MFRKIKCTFSIVFLSPLLSYADVIIGPGSISGPISVSTATSIVGSTTITSTLTNAGANVLASILTLDSLLGPNPSPIIIQTNNGNALNANGSYGVGLNMHMTSYDGRIGFKVKLT